MKKISLLIIILSSTIFSYGQKKNLSEQLWERVQSCYSMFEDEDNDGKADYADIIDDSKSGYLKVSGSFPTCGCSCENTVGAFRNDDDTYLFLKENAQDCSWIKEITANYDLKKVFPFDFETDGFFSKSLDNITESATFYIDIEIPRKGTDTKVWIKTIPFGLTIKSSKNIESGYSQEGGYSSNSSTISNVGTIVNRVKDLETLQYILNDEFEKISINDIEMIKKTINPEYNSRFKNKEELIDTLNKLKLKYELYSQIEYEWLILGWDRSKGSFYIKEKGESPKKISFIEFLKEAKYWSPTC